MGEAILTVSTSRGASKEILVTPPGTFRLAGRVTDTGQGAAVPNPRVEVVGGPAVTGDINGNYRLYGVPPDAEIRVSRDGYVALVQRMQLSANTIHNFRISLDSTNRNYTGTYTLVLEAVPNCAGSTPPLLASDLRRRSYDAVVTQSGTTLDVTLTEPRFVAGFNHFRGALILGGASFFLDWGYYDPWAEVTELFADNSRLVIWGSATTSDSPSGLSGTFSNAFLEQYTPTYQRLGSCRGATFSLVRR